MITPNFKGGDRNRKCYCGSNIKYKFCHYLIEQGEEPHRIKNGDGFIVTNPNKGKKLTIKKK